MSQYVLPQFSMKEITKGKIQISWLNPYNDCIQLSVQRSVDNKNFRTILSAQTPALYDNGFIDNKSPIGIKVYYRIFYVLKGGAYYFSHTKNTLENGQTPIVENNSARVNIESALIKTDSSKINAPKPAYYISVYKNKKEVYRFEYPEFIQFKDSIIHKTKDSLYSISANYVDWRPFIPQPKEYISVYKKDSLLAKLEISDYINFKDSISNKTKDTLYLIYTGRVELHQYIPKYVWKPSKYIFTSTKGDATILLPNFKQHRYRVVFFEENGTELFQMKNIKESEMILDKSNFIHAGWFWFELYEDEKLKEKNKFFLQKD